MTRIGWIGTGMMGSSMAGHLVSAGHDVVVFSRTRERARAVLEKGARWSDSPSQAVDSAEAVFLMLGYPTDVREVVLGEGGILDTMEPGSLLIDMTTSDPSLAAEIHVAAAANDISALDAPVSGGDVGARNATLAIMVGGDEEAYLRAEPLFGTLGNSSLLGSAGSGQHTKMVNQIAIAAGMIGMCEALVYAHRAGLDVELTIETIKAGAAGSWSLSNYGPRILRGDLEPGFKIDHFVKDLGIALAEGRRMRLALPGTALAHEFYIAAQGQGLGQKGTQALSVVLGRVSGGDWPTGVSV